MRSLMATQQVQDRLVDETKAAELLGVERHTLTAWRSRGTHALPFVKIGRIIRYRLSDLEEFIAARTVAE